MRMAASILTQLTIVNVLGSREIILFSASFTLIQARLNKLFIQNSHQEFQYNNESQRTKVNLSQKLEIRLIYLQKIASLRTRAKAAKAYFTIHQSQDQNEHV
jgi:hypothetical protein